MVLRVGYRESVMLNIEKNRSRPVFSILQYSFIMIGAGKQSKYIQYCNIHPRYCDIRGPANTI
jgi:hypothetical protein